MTTSYFKTAISGGGADALDGINGGLLSDEDFAFVTDSGIFYFYQLDADSAATPDIPSVVAPTVNAGDKRWLLKPVRGAAIGTTVTATGDITIDAVPYDVLQYIDPNGANRNIILTGTWTPNVRIKLFNIGVDYNLLFNSIDPILPDTGAQFGYDGTTWRRW